MIPQERPAHACKSSRFHISIEARTVQSSILESGPSRFPAHHKAAESPLNGARNVSIPAANADSLSPVDVRRANTSRIGSNSPASGMWFGSTTSPCSLCGLTRYRARLTALPAGTSGSNGSLALLTLPVPFRVHLLQKNVRIQPAVHIYLHGTAEVILTSPVVQQQSTWLQKTSEDRI